MWVSSSKMWHSRCNGTSAIQQIVKSMHCVTQRYSLVASIWSKIVTQPAYVYFHTTRSRWNMFALSTQSHQLGTKANMGVFCHSDEPHAICFSRVIKTHLERLSKPMLGDGSRVTTSPFWTFVHFPQYTFTRFDSFLYAVGVVQSDSAQKNWKQYWWSA